MKVHKNKTKNLSFSKIIGDNILNMFDMSNNSNYNSKKVIKNDILNIQNLTWIFLVNI